MLKRHLLIAYLLLSGMSMSVPADVAENSRKQISGKEIIQSTQENTPVSTDKTAAQELLNHKEETAHTTKTKNTALLKDVILVLDNSGSMKKNDRLYLTKYAVTEFINNLDKLTRVTIIIFDQKIRTIVPAIDISPLGRQKLLSSLSEINYHGMYTNSPSAIEKAIYELKNNAREDARKIIVFMTDGIVDTGNPAWDIEKTKWLKEDLAADAADAKIKIFGIAFTEDADFELIQSLSQKTDGEYYRVLVADDLSKVFKKVNELIHRPEQAEVTSKPPERIIERIIEKAPPPEPIIVEVPVMQPAAADRFDNNKIRLIAMVLVILLLAGLVAIFVLLRSNRAKPAGQDTAPEAYLNNIHGMTQYTTFTTFALSNKPTMLGRVAGEGHNKQLSYLVIPESTIGRNHALIEYRDFSYWIIDQGSINGTFVNDKTITSETRLKHGDIIRLHNIELEFVIPEMEEAGLTVISDSAISGHQSSNSDVTLMPDFDLHTKEDSDTTGDHENKT